MVQRMSSRRRFLAGATGASAVAIAGCLGGDNGDDDDDGNGGNGGDDDSTNIIVGASTSGSTTYEIAQSIQRVLDQESDEVDFDTQTTGGDPPGIRLWNEGDTDAYGVSNYTNRSAMEQFGPFEDEEVDTAYQGLSYFDRDDFFVAVDGSGIETTDDLPGRDIWMLNPGWGTREMTYDIFTEDEEYRDSLYENSVDIDDDDVAGAVEEGQIEALQAYGNNETNLPTWLRETEARVDLHYVEPTDEYISILEDSELTTYNEREAYGFDQDIGTDTFHVFTTPFQYYLDPDLPADAVYEVLDVCYNHHESMQEGMPAIFPYGDEPEAFTYALDPDMGAVHPGVADFLEDHDLWDDDLERGE